MSDLIKRQAAIDALSTCYDTETVTMSNGDEYINYEDAVGEIEQLPSAQPEKRTEERTETHACDLIDRQAAIDALKEALRPNIVSFIKAQYAIVGLPSTALKKLVRCGACRHNISDHKTYVDCKLIPEMFGRTADSYCSCAERRTDDE